MVRTPEARFNITAHDKTKEAFRSVRSQTKDAAAQFAKLTATATAVSGAFAVVVDRVLDSAQELDRIAKSAGTTAEEVQSLRAIVTDLGGSAEYADDALLELNQRMGEAVRDGGEMAEGFEGAGISLRNLADRDAIDVMRQAAGAIGSMASSSEQAEIAAKLFGDEAGRQLLPVLQRGTKGFDEMMRAARESGRVMSNETVRGAAEAAEQVDKLKGIITTQFTQAIAELAPDIQDMVEAMASDPEKIKDFAQSIVIIAGAVGGAASKFVEFAEGIGVAVANLMGYQDETSKSLEQFSRIQTQIDHVNSQIQRQEEARDRISTKMRLTSSEEVRVKLAEELRDAEAEINELIENRRQLNGEMEKANQDVSASLENAYNNEQVKENTKATDENTETRQRMTQALRDQVEAASELGVGLMLSAEDIDAFENRQWEAFEEQRKLRQEQRDEIQQQVDIIADSFRSREQIENDAYERRQETLENALEDGLISQQRYKDLVEQLERQHQENLTDIAIQAGDERARFARMNAQDQADTVVGFYAQMTQGVAQQSREMFEINKALAVAQATINAYEAISAAYAYGAEIGGPWTGAAFAALAAAVQFERVKAIWNTDYQGGGSGTAPSQANAGGGPQNPAQPQESPTLDVDRERGGSAGGNIVVNFNGPVSADSAERLAELVGEALREKINNRDWVLIESTSANGAELKGQ